ncbi:MAG: HesA/MoeB/ThiF family protein [Chitinophagaceae bacterium]
MNTSNQYKRYQRQILLPAFGIAAQEKLFQAKVLMIGAGGLGCPALQYLAAAGVGTIGIIDFDVVELSNLQRQTLFNPEDIGKNKARRAADRLRIFNPEIQIRVFTEKLDQKNALEIIDYYDIIIDGTDNFATRYMVNDACVILNKPLVYGAVLGFEGQVGVFNLEDSNSGIRVNYRDLFPNPPEPEYAPSCNEAGVLGVLPGIIGTMQASEAIKIITGIGKPLCNTILSYNALNNLFYEFLVSPAIESDGSIPKEEEAFKDFNYEWFCGAAHDIPEIELEEFDTLRKQESISIIDVRELEELPIINQFSVIKIPLSTFEDELKNILTNRKIVLICQTGKRSLKAARLLQTVYPKCIILSLSGGILGWEESEFFETNPIK